MAFEVTPAHAAIFTAVDAADVNLQIQAVAGAGKTTTLVQALGHIPSSQLVLMLAFNKRIADEMSRRVPQHVTARTLNSLGHGALGQYARGQGWPAPKLDVNKTRGILRDIIPSSTFASLSGPVSKLVRIAKSLGVVPRGARVPGMGLVPDEPATWMDMVDRYDVDVPRGFLPNHLVAYARDALKESLRTTHVIDFDDQLWMAHAFMAPVQQHDWVCIDEAQDLSPLQHELVSRAVRSGGRVIAVGDSCQTPSTVVSTPKGNVQLGSLRVGDLVISYNVAHAAYVKVGRKVAGITRRPYSGRMIMVVAGDRHSSYTPQHHCLVKFPTDDRHVVYLMRRGADYRVGACLMRYSCGFGPAARMRQENADAVWVLTTHTTRREALISEAVIAGRFGIPMTTFEPVNQLTDRGLDRDALDRIWTAVGGNHVDAVGALWAHGRDIQYPLCERNSTMAARRPIITRACNLFDGMQVRVFTGETHARTWTPIQVSVEQYVGDVISLDVERDHMYVGDGIVTHNCQAIYAFRGADSSSMDTMRNRFDMREFPLHVSYRCPQKVVRLAQSVVPHIQPHASAPVGTVDTSSLKCFDDVDFQLGDMIVCRFNAPLVKVCFALLRRHVPAVILGRDIGAGLIALVKRLEAISVDDLLGRLAAWENAETERFAHEDKPEKIEGVQDKADAIRVFTSGATSVHDVIATVERLFADDRPEAVVTLATIHKAKGLEATRVFLLDRDRMPSKFARKPWQMQQELNCIYIAYTRAQSHLQFIRSGG